MEEKLQRFDSYLKQNERSKQTRQSYMECLRVYFSMYEDITKENMIEFKNNEINSHSPNTARLRVIVLNSYCDFIGKEECKVKNVKIHNPSSVENVPTLQEYYYFLECLRRDNHMKLYWILRFIAQTGVRSSELVRLEKSCLSTGSFSMWSKGKIRKILIPSKLIKESREYFNTVESKYLFPNYKGEQMQSQSISKMLYQYGKRYYIRTEILHAHSYRHLFAIQFLENNGNLTLLSNLLGHENIRTTAIYTQLSVTKQKEELDKAVNW